MKTIKQRSVVPIYGVGGVWLLYTLFRGLNGVFDYIGVVILSFIAFFALRALTRVDRGWAWVEANARQARAAARA